MKRKRLVLVAWLAVWLTGCARMVESEAELDDRALFGDDVELVLCDPGENVCGTTCVDLSTSPTDCGACGHDCGGGTCAAGVCQPVAVADAGDLLDAPAALAVNGSAIFWSERTRVRSCPLPDGCVATPTVIATGYSRLRSIAASADKVYFSGCKICDEYHEFYECPVSGCPAPTFRISRTVYGYYRLLIGDTRAYAQESTENLVGCARSSCATTVSRWTLPGLTELYAVETDGSTLYLYGGGNLKTCTDASGCGFLDTLPGSSSVSPTFRARGGSFYWWAAGSPGSIRTCAISGCGAGTALASESNGAVELEVDASGVYWLNGTLGTVRHCPLAGCPGSGPTLLASGRGAIKELTLDAGFAYWIEGNTIVKVAKP
jgi:hypothetical protein